MNEALDQKLRTFGRRALVIGIVALALCATQIGGNRSGLLYAYLTGYLLWIGMSLGALALLMLHHLVGGGWGLVIRRSLEAATKTLPLMALLFVPILLGVPDLFSWADPSIVAADPLLQHKALYLNPRFFTVRAGVYFGVWFLFAFVMHFLARRQDQGKDPYETVRNLQRWSGPGILFYVVTFTFAAFDWVMSLDPHWFSTVFGLLFVVGHGVGAIALMIVVASWLSEEEPLRDFIAPNHFHDLGNLLLAFVMLWAYIAFSQYLIVWSGNLPEEIPWYLERTQHGWEKIAVGLILLHFAIPFLLLLSRARKRSKRRLVRVALLLIVLRFVDLFWIVAPMQGLGLTLHWVDIAAPIGIGGLWLATFTWFLQRRDLMPFSDPRMAEVFGYPEGEER